MTDDYDKHRRQNKAERMKAVSKQSRHGVKRGSNINRSNRTGTIQVDSSAPGYRLLRLVFNRAANQGISLAELAGEIGVSVSTLSHLRTGRRDASRLERESIIDIAEWLEMPVASVMLLAEQIVIEDFYGPETHLDSNIDMGLSYMAKDPQWGALLPSEVTNWRTRDQLQLIWGYEQATGRRMIPGGIDYQDLLNQMREFREEYPRIELNDSGSDNHNVQRGETTHRVSRTGTLQVDPEVPGYRLLQLVFDWAANKGISLAELAEEIGVSVSTVSHLRTGRRDASRLEPESIASISTWLEMPVLAVMILAEQVQADDFVGPDTHIRTNVDMAVRFMQNDPDWGGVLPRDIDDWSTENQLVEIWAYEQATGRRLMPGGTDYGELIKALQ